jgi:hypothetical protein
MLRPSPQAMSLDIQGFKAPSSPVPILYHQRPSPSQRARSRVEPLSSWVRRHTWRMPKRGVYEALYRTVGDPGGFIRSCSKLDGESNAHPTSFCQFHQFVGELRAAICGITCLVWFVAQHELGIREVRNRLVEDRSCVRSRYFPQVNVEGD